MNDGIPGRTEVLAMAETMPLRTLAPGEVLIGRDDEDTASAAVLVSGSLSVELDGSVISEITVPGAFVGEIGALLATARTASVVAREPSSVRIIGDPETFFADNPQLALELARQLAGRLHRLTAYLHDVRAQYADADGHLGMVDAVLGRLASRPPVDIEPGSDRAPDY